MSRPNCDPVFLGIIEELGETAAHTQTWLQDWRWPTKSTANLNHWDSLPTPANCSWSSARPRASGLHHVHGNASQSPPPPPHKAVQVHAECPGQVHVSSHNPQRVRVWSPPSAMATRGTPVGARTGALKQALNIQHFCYTADTLTSRWSERWKRCCELRRCNSEPTTHQMCLEVRSPDPPVGRPTGTGTSNDEPK